MAPSDSDSDQSSDNEYLDSNNAVKEAPAEEEIDPDLLFTHKKQTWDKRAAGNWRTRPSDSQATQPPGSTRLIFQAYDRSFGAFGPSSDDHTWIVLRSKPLVELLRTETVFKGVDGLDGDPPGLDARHIFLRLSELRTRAAVLEETEEVQKDDSGPETSSSQTATTPLPQSYWTLPFASWIPNFRGSQNKSTDDTPKPTLPPLSVPKQLSELLDFVEQLFSETREIVRRMRDNEHISYQLLWTMCAPDTIIESQDAATGKPIGIRVESWDYGNTGRAFKLYGTTYHWNGKMFHSKQKKIKIPRFKGLIKEKQLPIQFLSEETRATLVARGKLYKKYSGLQHLRYKSFVYRWDSESCSYYKLQAHGRVIVDAVGYDRFGTSSTNKYPYVLLSHICVTDVKTFPEQFDIDFEFSDDILCLMPPTQHGFAFAAKVWGLLNVEDMSEVVFNEKAFDQLVLSDEYKDIIKAQVEVFSQKGDQLVSDVVDDKGGGMIMVLHGSPGTGKTLTAEAISEHLKCPLYMVSSGELGTFASDLEGELRNILSMAASWNAIVLIDEADVFLEARDRSDSYRNARVSVFLRLLEYHTGVMILTSNRVRSFDRAFVSRFTIALHYPDLAQDSRLQIWREFLSRANIKIGAANDTSPSGPEYISHEDIMKLAKKPMNGRVIKQLVRGAQAIAIAKAEPMGLEHLQKVVGITEKFEADWKELGLADELEGDVAKADRERSMYS
ncbi:P-loop containing nucleoside triphosphate hydrolase protein [Ceratobasidium sp. AG-I]|nr:P-loop containing nucleoside triphosphate hydrolase protein [Ceratobasidium sp. AG-I]